MNPHYNYTMTDKELPLIMYLLNQFWGILFGYEINLFLHQKKVVYAATQSESQRVIHWWIILEKFGIKIQYISRVDIIVAEKISRLPYKKFDQ